MPSYVYFVTISQPWADRLDTLGEYRSLEAAQSAASAYNRRNEAKGDFAAVMALSWAKDEAKILRIRAALSAAA